MRLINVKAFLEREVLIKTAKQVDRRTKVLAFRNDETTDYAILSHRWIEQEVNYEEMVNLAAMEDKERDEIRQCKGYQKILDSCGQAKRDGYEWLWVDACCIDKRSSAELSEAINSMYRWYENSSVCYAYLHDVPGSSLPTTSDKKRYPHSNGWPEWFSRGWTLQEMIAPNNVQFFSRDWQCIGDKRSLAHALTGITAVPQHILTNGLSSNRPCVAQIMSWAANRTTTRVEDKAYSLMGLLDVNMPMLYGEGKKAFHRLQLEIIRASNDHSVFAWDPLARFGRTGSVLADDPSFFRDCSKMQLMDHNEFIRYLKKYIPEEELHSVEEDRFGTFPITNRGIQIWLLLCPYIGSRSVFEAWLPCRFDPSCPPVAINLALWDSNYYRYFTSNGIPTEPTLQFRQLYLRYQDKQHRDTTFEFDDRAVTENGLTYCGTYPSRLTGNTLIVTSTDPLYVKVYSDRQADCRFAVGFGQCFGQDWIHFDYEKSTSARNGHSWEDYAKEEHKKMLVRGPEHARAMAEARSRGERYSRVCSRQIHLPRSTWNVRASCVVWESSRNSGIMIEAFRYPGFSNRPDEWTGFDVERTNDPNRDMWGLMIRHSRSEWNWYELLVDGISMKFSTAPDGIKLGDYGHFMDSKDFRCEGNIFVDLKSLASKVNATPRQHRICSKDGRNTDSDYVIAHQSNAFFDGPVTLHRPLGLSLPSSRHFNSLLVSLSTRLTNKYLIARVVQCDTVLSREGSRQLSGTVNSYECGSLNITIGIDTRMDPRSTSTTTPLCTIAKPFVWHRNEGTSSTSIEWSGDELRAESQDGSMGVECVGEVASVIAKRRFYR
ncbi:heterokaryon incompatibility protein-domain-containing protein [Scleroderma yunnanense]